MNIMNTTPEQPVDIKAEILKKISANEVAMRPKMYFTLKLATLIVLASLVLGISVFLFNFILHSIHAQAIDSFLDFGTRGWMSFAIAFPWTLLIIDVACMAAFFIIGRRFNRGYRMPIMWNVVAIIVVTVAAGAIIDTATPINNWLHKDHPRYLPPQVKQLYLSYERPAEPERGTCLCNILSIGTSTFTVWSSALGSTTEFTIIVPPNAPYATTSGLAIGDTVMIAGEEITNPLATGTTTSIANTMIRAYGIRKVVFTY